ncbi:MAG: DUF4105 domain-containing protein [Deltaproteobacteria bacterium]|nr:DUF4105 domain-containing protein [Deltaproteobacteria bacterium]
MGRLREKGSFPECPEGKKGLVVMVRFLRLTFQVVLTPLLLLAVAWGTAALWIDGPADRWAAAILAGAFSLGCLITLVRIRPYPRAMVVVLAVFGVLLGWWLSIQPSNNRDWQSDVARSPSAVFEGERLTIHNVRNFDYRSETDFTERWETRHYDLSQLKGVDLFLSFWGPTLIAHTIGSWEFGDGSHLAISIETRKEKSETYSALLGFFRQFEVYYVVADERDLVRLRTNYRGERVFLYRTSLPPEEARELLLDYLTEANRLAAKPRWYNALSHNCTTAIQFHLQHLGLAQRLDWRILANGYLDELMYERGRIDTRVELPEVRRRGDITERAKKADKDPLFSARIREGVPNPRL